MVPENKIFWISKLKLSRRSGKMKIKPKYVPILKWKQGEQGALKELEDNIKDNIIPLIEITPNVKENKFLPSLSAWLNRPFYFDVLPECYAQDEEFYFKLLAQTNSEFVIPVLSLNEDDIDTITKAETYSNNGFALRITTLDADDIENKLDELLNIFSPNNIDLILDLKTIDNSNPLEKSLVLKSLLSDIPKLNEFRNIILSTSAFPASVSQAEKGELSQFDRADWYFWKKYSPSLNNKYNINLVFSDYTVNIPENIEFIIGMSPVFKIRYTTNDHFIILKGETIKKGGLEKEKISYLCQKLINSPLFEGEDFSWGDKFIFNGTQQNLDSYGNLATWVKVATNHHITLVVNQISNLV